MTQNKKDDLDSLRTYYDHNTTRFLSYGEQHKTRTIHRPVWGQGVQNEGQALHYIHKLIMIELHPSKNEITRHLSALDLGCGIGASLFYLADQLGESFTGIGLTISPVQVRIALAEQRTKDPKKRCMFLMGDFLAPPLNKQFDLIYSIESFAHTKNPKSYFEAAAILLKPGGRLVLCDDFLSENVEGDKVGVREKQWLEIFQQGWRVKGLWTPEYVQFLADSVSLTCMRNENLTQYLKLKPLPNVVVEVLSASIDFIPGKNLYWRSVIGGQALQLCLVHEMVEYRFLVFEKQSG